jgi:benzodiazapine receptor
LLKKRSGSLLLFLLICYGVAFVASLLTRPEIAGWYSTLTKPAWGPPNWLFGPVWTILYGLIAIAGWRVWCRAASRKRTAVLWLFAAQLAVNFLWSPVFFNLHKIGLAVFVIGTLGLLILLFAVASWGFERVSSWLFLPYLIWVSLASALNYTIWTMNPPMAAANTARPVASALFLTESLDGEGFPPDSSWEKASPVRFDTDWKGQNADPERYTEVRLLWRPETIFLRFFAKYRALNVYGIARADGWREELWERDVAEVFLQPDASRPLRYKEFEIAPNGFWIDLAISDGERNELHSGLRRRVRLDEKRKFWIAELALPVRSLTEHFDSGQTWRVNFYRVEGDAEPRFYSAWSPTFSPQPNFHVPDRFGTLVFNRNGPMIHSGP